MSSSCSRAAPPSPNLQVSDLRDEPPGDAQEIPWRFVGNRAWRLNEPHLSYSGAATRDSFFMDHREHLEIYLDGLRTAGVPDGSAA